MHVQNSQRRQKSRVALWWWALPAVIVTFLVHYASVAFGSVYAFTDWKGIGSFSFIGVENFAKIFSQTATQKALLNSVVVTVIFSVGTLFLGLLFALALNRGLKTRYLLRILLFAPVVLSALTVSYVWKFIFEANGPVNTVLQALGLESLTRLWLGDPATALGTIIFVMIWQNLGLTMVIFLAGLANIPEEVEEAAAVDGAGTLARFRLVTLPLLRTTIMLATVLMLIRGMGAFDQIFALTGGGPYGATDTMTTLIYVQTFVNGRFGYGAALSLILTAVVIVFAGLQMTILRNRKD